jgi:hypothetical protein
MKKSINPLPTHEIAPCAALTRAVISQHNRESHAVMGLLSFPSLGPDRALEYFQVILSGFVPALKLQCAPQIVLLI